MELTRPEARVLGCLIDQEALAPGEVPLTLNRLRLACNQTSDRDPVVAYDDRTVEDTLLALKSRGLARFVPPSSEAPTTRYRHRADERWRMGSAELAVLSVLLVQRVLTVSQVRASAQRIHPLITPVEVDAVLDSLAARTPVPFAARVGSPSGGEIHWVEVLTGPAPDESSAATSMGTAVEPVDVTRSRTAAETSSPAYTALVARVADLERRLAEALDERPGPEWMSSRPPPSVEVTPPRTRPASSGSPDWRDDRRPTTARAVVTSASPVGEPADEVGELVDRLRDVERRLARIEAELGALR